MLHFAIAGAGIGGLACAVALEQAGCRVTVFEKSPHATETGAGLQLSSNATAALRRLGLLERVREDAVMPLALAIGRGRDAKILTRLPLGPKAEERFGAPFLVTMRADLYRALREAVERTPRITLRMGTGLSGWQTSRDGATLHLSGTDPAPVTVDALVGADGLHSLVRETLGFGRIDDATDSRRTAWRATIDSAQAPSGFCAPQTNLWLGPGAHLVHYPVSGGRLVNVIAAVDEPRRSRFDASFWSTPGDPAEIAKRFAAWCAPIRQLIASAPAWRKWPLLDRPPLRRWSHGSVTLLGDAAHPMLPFLAQGAAQAVEDAVSLADAVSAHGTDPAAAFLAYEAARRPRTARIQAESRRQAIVYHLRAPASVLRDTVLRVTPAQRLLGRYDWLYAGPA